MDTKEWLMQGFKINNEINALIKTKEVAYRQLKSVEKTNDIESFPQYIELCAQIDKSIDILCETQIKIQKIISLVDNRTLRTLLTYRYLNFEKFERIAELMNHEYRWLMRLHVKALTQVEQILNPD